MSCGPGDLVQAHDSGVHRIFVAEWTQSFPALDFKTRLALSIFWLLGHPVDSFHVFFVKFRPVTFVRTVRWIKPIRLGFLAWVGLVTVLESLKPADDLPCFLFATNNCHICSGQDDEETWGQRRDHLQDLQSHQQSCLWFPHRLGFVNFGWYWNCWPGKAREKTIE